MKKKFAILLASTSLLAAIVPVGQSFAQEHHHSSDKYVQEQKEAQIKPFKDAVAQKRANVAKAKETYEKSESEFIRLSNELTKAQLELANVLDEGKVANKEANKASAEKIAALTAKQSELTAKISKLAGEIENAQNEVSKANTALRTAFNAYHAADEKVLAENPKLLEDVKAAENTLKEVTDKVSALQANQDTLSEELRHVQGHLPAFEAEELAKINAEYARKLKMAQDKVESLSNQKAIQAQVILKDFSTLKVANEQLKVALNELQKKSIDLNVPFDEAPAKDVKETEAVKSAGKVKATETPAKSQTKGQKVLPKTSAVK